MTAADSDVLAQAATLRTSLTTMGYEYLLHRQLFAEFLDAIVPLANQVPSLSFHFRTDAHIEFGYLGQQYCIRHNYDRDNKVSTLGCFAKASNGAEAPKHALAMDKSGGLGRPNDKPLWSVRGGSERAFYYLLLGQ